MENNRKMSDTLVKDGSTATERIHDIAETSWDKGRDTFKDLRAKGQDAIVQVKKNAQKAWNETHQLVQKHPGKSVGLALLTGMVIGGALMAMRRRD